MLHSHCYHHHLLLLTRHHYSPLSHTSPSLVHFVHKPITLHTVSAIPLATSPWLTHLAQVTNETEEGPNQLLLQFFTSIFNTIDDPFILQVSSTVLLTAIITAFFRNHRRRAKRSEDLKFRSSGAKKSVVSLKGMGSSSNEVKSKKLPSSPVQALLGAVIAGVIALLLYKFTISIDAAFSRQGLSHNFSVRQATITIRTIIIDLCFFATFVYGICSIGLLLYSGELALNIFVGGQSGKGTRSKITKQSDLTNSSSETLSSNNELVSTKEDQSTKNSQ